MLTDNQKKMMERDAAARAALGDRIVEREPNFTPEQRALFAEYERQAEECRRTRQARMNGPGGYDGPLRTPYPTGWGSKSNRFIGEGSRQLGRKPAP